MSLLMSVWLFLTGAQAPVVVDKTVYFTVIECSFTEPFLTVSFVSKQDGVVADRGLLLTIDDVETATDKKYSIETITIKDVTSGEFEETSVLKEDLSEILHLTKNNSGSDGMSETVYTYHATYILNGQTLYGGCESEEKSIVLTPKLQKALEGIPVK
jgi:uncharacterized membrane protein